MGAIKEVHVPDIGDFSGVDVVEVLVSPGDTVAVEDPLISLESDKASMEVPSPEAGVVTEVKVKSGDKVSEGDLIVLLEADAAGDSSQSEEVESPPAAAKTADNAAQQTQSNAGSTSAAPSPEVKSQKPTPPAASQSSALQEVKIPDIGDFHDVDVIDVLVKPGDNVDVETPLIMLESDKASMEVPSPEAGVIKELRIKPGDKVSQGDVVLILETEAVALADDEAAPPTQPPSAVTLGPTARKPATFEARQPPIAVTPVDEAAFVQVHASPSVRRFARELGADLSRIGEGSGRKGRITKDDVQQFIKQVLAGQTAPAAEAAPGGSGIPPIPAVDFEKFGPIETQPLTKIKRLTGTAMSRNWLNVPHVTHHDEADITETEAFRKSLAEQAKARDVRVTMVSFLLKVCAVALQEFPTFNASLDPNGEQLIVKKYIHIGVAVDTPDGLVVPVIRDVDQKTLFTLSKELSEYSAKARAKQLMPGDMQGGCFTISSLGGIGGTAFTPIVNAPEVAILGITRARMTPTWDGKGFVPRLLLPLSLSYDHRVIDGALAARFVRFTCEAIADMRRLLL